MGWFLSQEKPSLGKGPYFSVENWSLGRGGTCGGGTGEGASLKASVPLSEWLLERGL